MGLKYHQVLVEFTDINCGECGGVYAINEGYRAEKEITGGSWHCPYCQVGWGYSKNNENARLKKQLQREQERREWAEHNVQINRKEAEHHRHRANAYKGHLTKTKNRIKNGVCPCCNRTFANLTRHMKTQHPNYQRDT